MRYLNQRNKIGRFLGHDPYQEDQRELVGIDPLEPRLMLSTYYVDADASSSGSDGSLAHPWNSLDQVNAASLVAGDSVLFQRGDTWRGRLVAQSGTTYGVVTYGAYGDESLPDPVILGSSSFSNTSDWVSTGTNLWTTIAAENTVTADGFSEIISNPNFNIDASGWTYYAYPNVTTATGGYNSTEGDPSAGCYSLTCTSVTSRIYYGLRAYATGLNIQANKYYLLTFHAKASESFALSNIYMSSSSTGTVYTNNCSENISTSWETHSVVFYSTGTDSSARLSFFMGDTIPVGATFYIDTVSLKQCVPLAGYRPLVTDVGNIIFNNSGTISCGTKKFSLGELSNNGDFYYDPTTESVTLYTSSNPAGSNPELALNYSLVEICGTNASSQKQYIQVQSLDLKYSGRYGVGIHDANHVTITDCTVSYIGGCHQSGTPSTRYGNGVEIDGNADHILVEKCTVSEIYDAALSNQWWTDTEGVTQSNITYRNNLIWNSEYSYEYFMVALSGIHSPSYPSYVSNIAFENNTCWNAGGGWGHGQRPVQNGWHLKLNMDWAPISGYFSIRNNIFDTSTLAAIKLTSHYIGSIDVFNANLAALNLDYNIYHGATGSFAYWGGIYYSTLAEYQAASQKDGNSSYEDPDFVNTSTRNFQLLPSSPAIDTGTSNGIHVVDDITGQLRPLGNGHDKGAYENIPGLVANWKFDETTQGTVYDSYAEHNGTNSSATVGQSGQLGIAYSFDGINDLFYLPYGNGLSTANPYTYSVWVNSTDISTSSRMCVVQGSSTNNCRFYMGQCNGYWQFGLGTSAWGGTPSGAQAVTAGWHLLTLVTTTTGPQTTGLLYVDGVATYSKTVSVFSFNSSLVVGAFYNNYYWKGSVDDLKVYTRALTSTQIQDEYQHGISMDLSPYAVLSYGGAAGQQDQTPLQYGILDQSNAIHLEGNTWKALDLTTGGLADGIAVSSSTVLEFDFFSDGAVPEIASIGLDTNLSLSEGCTFKLYGTQTYGNAVTQYTTGSGWVHYQINIGSILAAGQYNYLTLICDADAGQATSIYFKNIRFHS